ncbi:MAG TPA: hypothetical protein VM141_03945 [Planctomycetota bacterium]|nr:hypothetical protein [Planctomycetota bacterium]
MMQRLLVCTAICFTSAAACSAQDDFWIGAFGWLGDFQSSIATPQDENSVNLGSDLQYDPIIGVPYVKFQATVNRRWYVRGEYWATEQTSRTVLARDVQLDGTTFNAGESVSSRYLIQVGEGSLLYVFYRESGFRLSGIQGFNVLNFQMHMENAAQSDAVNFTVATAPFGVMVEYDFLPDLTVQGLVVGIPTLGANERTTMVMADLLAIYRFAPYSALGVGYKAFWFSSESPVQDFRYRLAGPYAGFIFRF